MVTRAGTGAGTVVDEPGEPGERAGTAEPVETTVAAEKGPAGEKVGAPEPRKTAETVETTETAGAADTDTAFAHLRELVDLLPQMQGLSARLATDAAAREVLAADRAHVTDASMLKAADDNLARARAALARAKEAGAPAEEVGRRERELLACGNERGLRTSPEAQSRARLARALEAGGFAGVEDARAALMGESEAAAARARIASYQRDYAQTLEACQAAEGEG